MSRDALCLLRHLIRALAALAARCQMLRRRRFQFVVERGAQLSIVEVHGYSPFSRYRFSNSRSARASSVPMELAETPSAFAT